MIKTTTSLAIIGFASAAHGQLMIDFNSTTQGGGPTNEPGYQAYDAAHENTATFDTKSYNAFGTAVSLTPSWPNTTDNRVQQMIDRGAGNDAQWLGSNLDLLTDFIGIDTRTGNGGNGDWDGTTGTPTHLDLTLSGVPAGSYSWTSYHHDTENVWADYSVGVSLDGGSSFTSAGAGSMTSSSSGGNPANPNRVSDGSADTLSSTFRTAFAADGANDVVIRFTPMADTQVHRRIFAVNGFELAVVPEPSTALLGLFGLALAFRRRR